MYINNVHVCVIFLYQKSCIILIIFLKFKLYLIQTTTVCIKQGQQCSETVHNGTLLQYHG